MTPWMAVQGAAWQGRAERLPMMCWSCRDSQPLAQQTPLLHTCLQRSSCRVGVHENVQEADKTA